MTKKKLVLVDGSSYLFRAYHALPPLVTQRGQPTGAIYGVVNMLKRLLKDEKPEAVAVIFDTKEKTFRHERYEAYKANRPPMPDDLAVQIKPLHELIEAMGLPLLKYPGYEADDVIGTLTREALAHDMDVLISTGDKDIAQLVQKGVTLVNTMTGVVLDDQTVFEKFGVRPDQIIDYLALIGDPVDNVPGIPKVGPKTAAKWLEAYDTLDKLVLHADEIKGKIGEQLRSHMEALPLSKELVTIHQEVPLQEHVKDLVLREPNTETLHTLFTELEFKAWLRDLENPTTSTKAVAHKKAHYQTVFDFETLLEFIQEAKKKRLFCFDLETTSLNTLQAEIVGIALSLEPYKAFYVPLSHNESPESQLDIAEVLEVLSTLWQDQAVVKLGHNIKYDIEVLLNYDIQVKGSIEDTMLASYVCNSIAVKHNMDALASYYLNYKTTTYEEIAGKGAKQIPFSQVSVEEASQYAAEDADVTFRLHHVFQEKFEDAPKLTALYRDLECALVPVLVAIEHYGVKVDSDLLLAQSAELEIKLQELEKQSHILAGEDFNLSSPKQLQVILFEKLGLPVQEKTPTGQPSTAENVLQELSHEYELPKLILEHRSLSKLKSTYTDKLPLVVDSKTGRIHTSYHQAVTATGRLSSSDPNLQNIPIRTEEGQRIRKAFIAESGCKLVAADYSQIELRIMAHISEDEGLIRAFEKGQDIHQFTASEMFGIPLEEVSTDQRRSAKAINFGLIYGMSAFGLARQLETSREVAQEYMDHYFTRYPGVKRYMEHIREQASKYGFVETLDGRRLYLPDIKSSQVMKRKAAERTAVNAPMQGTAADLIKKAMISIHNWIQSEGKQTRMIMQVHDELVFEVPEHELVEVCVEVKKRMEQAMSLRVPLLVTVGVGLNWQEAH